MRVYTEGGSALELRGPELGSGAEGRVLAMEGFPGRVAKVYLADEPERTSKVQAMARLAPQVQQVPELATVAWPLAPLYCDPGCRELAGFGMTRLDVAASFGELYQYPDTGPVRLDHATKARLVADLARTLHALHEQGHVVGDLNDRNIVLTRNGRAGLVDADSFVVGAGGRRFRCAMGTGGYIAPELVRAGTGTDFAHLDPDVFCRRTDRFALAIHAFRMLMNGAHPYHCAGLPGPNGSVPAPLPLDRRVERGETPFFRRVPGHVTPPFSPGVDVLPSYLRLAFAQAFVEGQRHPERRPSCLTWAALLDRYACELRPCRADPRHRYHRDLASCPYCAADRRASAGLLAPAGSFRPPPMSASSMPRSLRRRSPVNRPGAAAAASAVPTKTTVAAVPARAATAVAPAAAPKAAVTGNTGWWVALLAGTLGLWVCVCGPDGPVTAFVAEQLGALPEWYLPVSAGAAGLAALGFAGLSSERSVPAQLKACACGLLLSLAAAGVPLLSAAAQEDPEALAEAVVTLIFLGFLLWMLARHPKLLFWGVVALLVMQGLGGL